MQVEKQQKPRWSCPTVVLTLMYGLHRAEACIRSSYLPLSAAGEVRSTGQPKLERCVAFLAIPESVYLARITAPACARKTLWGGYRRPAPCRPLRKNRSSESCFLEEGTKRVSPSNFKLLLSRRVPVTKVPVRRQAEQQQTYNLVHINHCCITWYSM